jgi:hypothetical protein
VDARADTNEFLSRTPAPDASRMPAANGADSSADLAATALLSALGRVIAAYSEVPLPARARARTLLRRHGHAAHERRNRAGARSRTPSRPA